MSVFKNLQQPDVFLTKHIARKQWEIPGNLMGNLGITVAKAYSGSVPIREQESYRSGEGDYESRLLYRNILQSYEYVQRGVVRGSADVGLDTALYFPERRQLPGPEDIHRPDDDLVPFITVLQLPKSIVGTGIEPGTLQINISVDGTQLPDLEGHGTEEISIWDREGVLFATGFTGKFEEDAGFPETGTKPVGDIIYSSGLIIFTDPFEAWVCGNVSIGNISLESRVEISTYNVHCPVEDREFNATNNPTARELNRTEDFRPYITQIGLYNSSYELVAVAKLSKPVKKEDCLDTTFNIQIDI